MLATSTIKKCLTTKIFIQSYQYHDLREVFFSKFKLILHIIPYKSRFIVNSNSYSSIELSILLTSCLTTIKSML